MATSSLKKSFVISSKKEAESLAKMFEESLKKPWKAEYPKSETLAPKAVMEFFNGKRK